MMWSLLLKEIKPKWLNISTPCCLCLAESDHNGHAICQDCWQDLPHIIQGCERCQLPVLKAGLCGQCIAHPPNYHKIISPWCYEFPIAQLITRFKHQKQWPLGYMLTGLLGDHLQTCYQQGLDKPDCLVIVPLSKKRFRERGFNQTQMMAQWLSKQLNVTCCTQSIKRVLDTPAQQTLSAKQRQQNLKNAFAIKQSDTFTGLHVALIDDVVTTGTTANTISTLLYKAGAKRVDIYCLARTPFVYR